MKLTERMLVKSNKMGLDGRLRCHRCGSILVYEFDADIQWRPQWKFLKGLWFRVRYAMVHQYERPNNTINDFRVIVNYDFPLL